MGGDAIMKAWQAKLVLLASDKDKDKARPWLAFFFA